MMEREVSEHIYTLCRWAITPFREGDFRAYSVSTMLDIWKNGVSDVDEKLERQTVIQSSLVEFLDMYSFGQLFTTLKITSTNGKTLATIDKQFDVASLAGLDTWLCRNYDPATIDTWLIGFIAANITFRRKNTYKSSSK